MSADVMPPASNSGVSVIQEQAGDSKISVLKPDAVPLSSAEERIDGGLIEQQDVPALAAHLSHVNGDSLEDLYHRFAKVLGSTNVSRGSQSILDIPRDFRMQLEGSEDPHAVTVALCQQLFKNRQLKRRRGSAASLGKRTKSQRRTLNAGFDPVQLLKKRAIHLAINSPNLSSTLNIDIHPIFRAENFHGCPDQLYEQFRPALRLATLMLTHRACSQYWHTLWFGRRQHCEDTSSMRQKSSFRIKEDVSWNSEQARTFAKALNQHAERVHFYFNATPFPQRSCHASTFWVLDTNNPFPLHHARDYETFKRGKICLHTDFYTVAKRNSLLSHHDHAALLRYQFWLAVSLCHEMAHYFESQRRFLIPDHEDEAFWYEDDWNEAGERWEKNFFGGRVEPIAARADCKYGIAVVDWPMVPVMDMEVDDGHDNIYWTLPMEYISELQQQKTWDLLAAKEHAEADTTAFHIPRIGTRSVNFSSVNMTVWEDEAEDKLISDDLDDVDTVLKRTCNGRIVKRTREKRRMGLMMKSKKEAQGRRGTDSSSDLEKVQQHRRTCRTRGMVKLEKEREAEAKSEPKTRARKPRVRSPEKSDDMEE